MFELVKYLRACNEIFERGILGKKAFVHTVDSPVLESIRTGFKYFTEWADLLIQQGYNLQGTSFKVFLSHKCLRI